MGKYMKYEKTPVKKSVGRKLVKDSERKSLASISTGRILGYLYKRHETELLYVVVCLLFAVIIWVKLG